MTFSQLQQIVRDMILADSWFAGLPVLVEARGDFETELQIQLDKMGVSVVVATPDSAAKEDAPQPHVVAQVVVAIAEIPLTNNTDKHAAEALDRIIPLLHRQRIGGPGSPRLSFQGHDSEDFSGMAAYRVRFAVGITHQVTQ